MNYLPEDVDFCRNGLDEEPCRSKNPLPEAHPVLELGKLHLSAKQNPITFDQPSMETIISITEPSINHTKKKEQI